VNVGDNYNRPKVLPRSWREAEGLGRL